MEFVTHIGTRSRNTTTPGVFLRSDQSLSFNSCFVESANLKKYKCVVVRYAKQEKILSLLFKEEVALNSLKVQEQSKKYGGRRVGLQGVFQFFKLKPTPGVRDIVKGTEPGEYLVSLNGNILKDKPAKSKPKTKTDAKLRTTKSRLPKEVKEAVANSCVPRKQPDAIVKFNNALREIIKNNPGMGLGGIYGEFSQYGINIPEADRKKFTKRIQNRISNDREIQSLGFRKGYMIAGEVVAIGSKQDDFKALREEVTRLLNKEDEPVSVQGVIQQLQSDQRWGNVSHLQHILKLKVFSDREHFEYVPGMGYTTRIPVSEL